MSDDRKNGPAGLEREDDWMHRLRTADTDRSLGRIADYELLQEVGRGGQGIVYRARQTGGTTDYAVKVLRREIMSDERGIARFEREAELLATLDTPGVVRVEGLIREDGILAIVMEWVEGERINEWWSAWHDERDPEESVEVMIELIEIVHEAHLRGVIHRDLKPSNVLVDREGSVRVLDFGIARSIDPDGTALTASRDILGTPLYAAPEQLSGRSPGADLRCDIFALGVLWYELLTGSVPGSQLGVLDLIRLRAETSFPRPSTTGKRIDRELETVLLTALSIEPQLRYQSASSFVEDLRRYNRGEPVKARRPSWMSLVMRWGRKNPVLAALGVLLAVSVVVALWVTFDRSRQLAAEQRSTLAQATRAVAFRDLFQGSVGLAARRSFGEDVSVRTLLEAASERLDGMTLSSDARLELHLELAQAFTSLREYELALGHITSAKIASQVTLVPERSALVDALELEALVGLGRIRELAPKVDRIEALVDRIEPPRVRVELLSALGSAYSLRGDHQNAELRLGEAIRVASAADFSLYDLTAERMMWAYSLLELGRGERGRGVIAQIVEDEADLGAEESARGILAELELVRYDLALESVQEDAVVSRLERLESRALAMDPPDVRLTIAIWVQMAELTLFSNPDLAREKLTQANALARASLGTRDESYTRSLSLMLALESVHGQFDRAIEIATKALDTLTESGSSESFEAYEIYLVRGMSFGEKGELEASRRDLKRARQLIVELRPAESIDRHAGVPSLARSLELLGETEELRALLEEGLRELEAVPDLYSSEVVRILVSYEVLAGRLGDPDLIGDVERAMSRRMQPRVADR